jgi:polar amino acid transport system substrate-binding protein
MVRVQVTEAYNNCPRYIHKYQRVEPSPYVPRAGCEPPVPEWKLRDDIRPILPANDPARILLASCATMTPITPAVRAELASTGKIRAGINYGNSILATKDKASGESRGVAVDLLYELGRRLGVPVEIIAYDSVAVMGDAAPTGAWDIAFLGSDPEREKLMSFTAAYLEIEATYLVAGASPLRTATDVDREGVRISAPARGNYELYLQRNLKRAQLVSTQGADAAFDLLATGKVDALAGLKQGLTGLAEKLPGSRIVDGRFMAVQQSIAVPKGREAGLQYLRSVVEDAKASGLVARAIEKTGARGVAVAPPAK